MVPKTYIEELVNNIIVAEDKVQRESVAYELINCINSLYTERENVFAHLNALVNDMSGV